MDPSNNEGSLEDENLAETRRLLAELNSMARELESERRRDRLTLSRRQTRLNDGVQTSTNVAQMVPPSDATPNFTSNCTRSRTSTSTYAPARPSNKSPF